jgi:hypothetical protein
MKMTKDARFKARRQNACRRTSSIQFGVLAVLLGCSVAKGSSVNVSGQADIFVSGTTSAPSGALLPSEITFPSGAGQVLTFPDVTGLTSYGYPTATIGPDGGPASGASTTGSDFASQGNGLSGIINDPGEVFFLVGVFLGSSAPPAVPPPTLDFTNNVNFPSLSPLIGQLFYIGDGLTGTGSGQLQQFLVPEDATRLFLGFADGAEFRGAQTYADNSGSLSVPYQFQTVPEPGSLLLLVLGISIVCGVSAARFRGHLV